MRHNKREENKELFLIALEKTLGIVSAACKEIGISRDTYYKWLRDDPEFKKKVDDMNEYQVDFVENQLFKKIKAGSERAILFYMKYKGKNRGYASRTEITGANGDDLFSKIEFKFGSKLTDKKEENE